MQATQFDRDAMAAWYAGEHLKTDPGLQTIYYLPTNAGDREIRFIEVNIMMGERTDDILEPIDFGIDVGTENAHRLVFLDCTPEQWERMRTGSLALPEDWTLDGIIRYGASEDD